ncbi:MAG: type II secretion system protein N [Thioalkalivibrionaceae bacterium]
MTRTTGRNAVVARMRAARVWAAWVILGLVLFVGALLLRMPAGVVLDRVFAAAGDQGVTLSTESIAGPWWAGEIVGLAWRAQSSPNGAEESGALEAAVWRWRPMALLRGAVAFDLTMTVASSRIEGRVEAGLGGVALHGLDGVLSAEGAMRVWSGWPLLLDGRLTADAVDVALRRDGRFGASTGRLFWQGAGAGLPRPVSLGDQRVTLSERDGQLVLTFDSGPDATLALSGSLYLAGPAGDWRYAADVEARVDDSVAGRQVGQALDALAAPSRIGDRVWRFVVNQQP